MPLVGEQFRGSLTHCQMTPRVPDDGTYDGDITSTIACRSSPSMLNEIQRDSVVIIPSQKMASVIFLLKQRLA